MASAVDESLPVSLQRLVSRLAANPGTVTSAEFLVATRRLHRSLARRFPSMSWQDIEDATGATLSRLVERARDGVSVPSDGYVFAAATNAAVDMLRMRRRIPLSLGSCDLAELLTNTATSDDDIASGFEAMATAASVHRALAAARAAGDGVAFRVVTEALNQVQTRGVRPSNRALAQMLGVSHTAVGKALARFRGYLELAS
jgi:DNA-directed RNA polymerase specialized sigma24 family protein